jgi:hypothetical protein
MEGRRLGARAIVAKSWEDRWLRFRMALMTSGVEPRMHDSCRSWILGFLKFIKPRRHTEAMAKDVEEFLTKLGAQTRRIGNCARRTRR